MVMKGLVSSASGTKARVTFPDMDKVVSFELAVCEHVGELHPGDTVIVVFWDTNYSDGSIVGKVT